MPLTADYCGYKDEKLEAGELELPLVNGTSVMIAAAAEVCTFLGMENPYAIIAGDIGAGDGSNQIYRFLRDSVNPAQASRKPVYAMHYIKPNILYAREAVRALKRRLNPILIADAGSMYVAKAAGIAREFDLFTPDPGEMAFLADSEALHPAYVRNYIFDSLSDIPKLIKQAYEYSNAPRVLLVKGPIDYIVDRGEIVEKVVEPCIPALEPIGGTGDTLSGIVSALIASGLDVAVAAVQAAKANRLMGSLCDPKPSTRVWEMIPRIPEALEALKITGRN
jgi:hypothetical protein